MTSFIDVSRVIIPPDRQREEFDQGAINELAESISTSGLMQPIILRREGEAFVLVAGHRRLMAVQDIWSLGMGYRHGQVKVEFNLIPYVDFGELTVIERLQLEYDENEKRVNLNWKEKAAATEKLARLRRAQAEEAGLPAPTLTELATEVRPDQDPTGRALDDTSKELIVAKTGSRQRWVRHLGHGS